jgi:hypothetical protein
MVFYSEITVKNLIISSMPDGKQGITLHFQKELFILVQILQMVPRRNPIHKEY